jgi:hypothetical protein
MAQSYTGEMFDLSGRTAVVTGGAGVIGTDLAVALARAGARVALWDVRDDALAAAAERIRKESGRKDCVLAQKVDLMSEDSLRAGIAAVLAAWALERFQGRGAAPLVMTAAAVGAAVSFASGLLLVVLVPAALLVFPDGRPWRSRLPAVLLTHPHTLLDGVVIEWIDLSRHALAASTRFDAAPRPPQTPVSGRAYRPSFTVGFSEANSASTRVTVTPSAPAAQALPMYTPHSRMPRSRSWKSSSTVLAQFSRKMLQSTGLWMGSFQVLRRPASVAAVLPTMRRPSQPAARTAILRGLMKRFPSITTLR